MGRMVYGLMLGVFELVSCGVEMAILFHKILFLEIYRTVLRGKVGKVLLASRVNCVNKERHEGYDSTNLLNIQAFFT